MRIGDRWILAAVLLVALGLALPRLWFSESGYQAVVTTPFETHTLSLKTDQTLTLVGRDDMAITLEVKNGAVQFVASDCPHHLCVHTGALQQVGASAACVPAGITVRVIGQSGEVDAVAR